MKPTKSHKKTVSKKSSSSINNYFKTAPKEPVVCAPSDVKSFYVGALLNKLKSFDDESTSTSENNTGHESGVIDSTTSQTEKNKSNERDFRQASNLVDINECNTCEKWRKKYKEMEKSYLKLSVCYTDLMMKHNDLVQVSTGAVRPYVETEQHNEVQHKDLTTSVARPNTEAEVSQTLPEAVAGEIFTDNEIKCLKCIPLNKKQDSTFVFSCVQYAYKNNAASLTQKTLKGTRARYEINEGEVVTVKAGKDPLTPEKVTRIRELFIDRVTKSKCLAVEFGERVKQTNFNQLVANAVKNLANKHAPKKVQSEPNADLNL